MTDIQAVAELWRISKRKDMNLVVMTEEDVQRRWQRNGFYLAQDAWVIVTTQGCVVAYADVQREEEQAGLMFALMVHPAYRGRGIGTLLLRMVEQRARELTYGSSTGEQVALCIAVHSQNRLAKQLLEREGYTASEHFWRVSLERDDVLLQSLQEPEQEGSLTMDLYVDASQAPASRVIAGRADSHVAQQYEVYQRVLRPTMSRALLREEAVC
ncbi:GNAT family N-acetyltransferase [Ktedonobacter racemifer]|nr:GNAT family N-acetyltransferase [Ktedonobacter racemifer]